MIIWDTDDERTTPTREARVTLAVSLALGLALMLWGSLLTLGVLWLAGVWS
jgi:hypothetical protein